MYVKANRKTVEYLNLQNERNSLADNNFILWETDLFPISTDIEEALRMTGSIIMTPEQALAEQDEDFSLTLPEPEDPRFKNTNSNEQSSSVENN
jgi:hypothetical protein